MHHVLQMRGPASTGRDDYVNNRRVYRDYAPVPFGYIRPGRTELLTHVRERHDAAIEFGDGQATEFARTPAPSMFHTYASAGTYTATVTRRTACSSWGCSGSSTIIGTATITVGSTSPFSIRSPTSGQSTQQGQGLTIAWDSQNAPAGSAAAFWLVKSNCANLGLIARNQLPKGTFSWQVPGSRCNASGVCITLVDSPSAYYSDVGTYWIVGKLYSPVDAYLGGFPPANPITPTFLATATSSLFNITE